MTDTLIAMLDKTDMRKISTDLWGVFFEDISYSGDGGINSELVQNGAFEYNRTDRPEWSNYTAWRRNVPAGSFAAFSLGDRNPVAVQNPHYAVVEVDVAPASLENLGFDGMVFRAGETYRFSLWARAHGEELPLNVALLGDQGEALAEIEFTVPRSSADGAWSQLHGVLTIASDVYGERGDDVGRTVGPMPIIAQQGALRITFAACGTMDLDFASLEPQTTYRGLEHFRPDLVQTLAELHPRFMRFPGGCITHGLGLGNLYRWDQSIGDVERRPHNFNVWGYHQSLRIGFYEYFRLCETIGAKPVPVLPAAVSCQNTSQGPVPIAQEDMPAYIDEVLGLIDFCNADPARSPWAVKRAEMGHPDPFGLEYLGIGNEDLIDDVFMDRFQQIVDAVKKTHPEITVIGTVGPSPSGADYDAGWAYARQAGLQIVDEHSYQSPSWWFHNLHHYDGADRQGPKVYLGEYGSWGTGLINALSEAAFMGRMELNGDVVHMASYAPLLCKNGHESWNPNLIYFDNERVYHPYSYWIQQMYATTAADTAWPVTLSGATTLRRRLPNTVRLRLEGGAHADFTDVSIETEGGERLDLPDVSYSGARVDLPVSLHADSYTIRATVTYHEGMWGVNIVSGDIDGINHNETSLGRGFALQLIREKSGYPIASTETAMDAVRPGTVWHVRIEVRRRGESMALYIDDQLVLDGHEDVDEQRRTVSVSRDCAAGTNYIRIVNALPDEARFDLVQILDELSVSEDAKKTAVANVLSGPDPYAGTQGAESPTHIVARTVDLRSGVYTAPAWSFTTLVLARP
ncbi:MAG: alpha-L-arabinofuranosidase [Bifidobacterium sp.]|jgi:alpha-L-arabinofuranosidase|nr:alpha-L-arabinofuranosidase [Bifidobacterium sp.]